ncbi:AsmA family protein [Immundisolibacter sp.]|uniref:AsmA family protein n=1 Tax=Immundisolibacter sp. TaxID=1934948 RepID=UPI003F829270
MKWIRRLLVALLVLVAVLGATAVLLPRLVDSDTLRSMLIVAARSHTGRELTVDGDIRVAVLPRPAVVLPRLALADADGFGPEPFASLDGARANLRLWPLLRGRLQVASVEVERPQLRLTVDAAGRSNWGDLLPEPQAEASPAPASSEPGIAASLAGRVGIGRMRVNGGDLLWTDRRSGRWARVRDLDVAISGLDPGRPIPLTASATLETGDPVRSVQLDLETDVQWSGEALWHARALKLDAIVAGAPLRGQLPFRLTGEASFDPAQSRLALQDLTLAGDPLSLAGDLTVAQAGDGPVVGAQLRMQRLDVRALAQQMGVELATADAEVLRQISGSLELRADAGQVNLARMELAVDGSQWRGSARVRDFAQPAIRFELEGDGLDLDRYLPPTPASGSAKPGEASELAASDVAVAASPADVLRRAARHDVQGTVTVGSLKLRGIATQNLSLQVRSGRGRLALEPVSTALYGGALEASARVDASGRGDPRLRLKLSATDVSIAPLLLALADQDVLQGRFTAGVEVSGIAATGDALLRSLNGTARLNGTDGVLKGINPDRSICQARAAIDAARGREVESCDPSPDAQFSVLRMSGPIKAGVWRSEDLMVEQVRFRPDRFYRITGTGTLDLVSTEIDYRLRAASVRRGADGASQEDVREAPVPLRVRGRPGAFTVQPELKDVLRDEALRRLQEKLESTPDGDDEEAPAKQLLRGLFGR